MVSYTAYRPPTENPHTENKAALGSNLVAQGDQNDLEDSESESTLLAPPEQYEDSGEEI